MTQAHQNLPLRDLIAVLESLCQQRLTGTMFLHTDSNRSARISLERGRIVFIAHGRHRGMDAVEQFKQMDYGKFSFDESLPGSVTPIPLPPTPELLSELSWAASPEARAVAGTPEPAASPAGSLVGGASGGAAPRTDPPAAWAEPLSAEDFAGVALPGSLADPDGSDGVLPVSGARLYDAVLETLALSIGPVASVVADDYREQLLALSTPAEFRALAARIATEVDDADAERFLARVLARAGL